MGLVGGCAGDEDGCRGGVGVGSLGSCFGGTSGCFFGGLAGGSCSTAEDCSGAESLESEASFFTGFRVGG